MIQRYERRIGGSEPGKRKTHKRKKEGINELVPFVF